MALGEGKLNDFMGQFVHDFGAAMHAAATVVGGQLGLREWLSAQAAGAYVRYEPEGERFSLTEEQAFVLAGAARMREVVTQGGFTHFRRATQTPFNLVCEAHP